jgi:hypothetical protein
LLIEWALAIEAENESLRATIETLNTLIFGARSERLSTISAEQLARDLIEGKRRSAANSCRRRCG